MSKKEVLFLSFFIALFIFIRSIHFSDYLFFNNDQGEQAAQILDLWRQKKITLLGNRITSMSYESKNLFQGPATYYFMFLFLFIGKFDPVISSYAFMLFSALMIVPLYIGMRMLSGERRAIFMTIVYTLYPFYVPYTRFLWNPNFQYSLLPILIFLLGKFYKERNGKWLLLSSIFLGILFQFHYQFIFVLISISLWLIFLSKDKLKSIFFIVSGITLGLSPFLLFEVRNKFYNTILAFKMITHLDKMSKVNTAVDHYYLSISFMLIIVFVYFLPYLFIFFGKQLFTNRKKSICANMVRISDPLIIISAIAFFLMTAVKQFPKPKLQFWSPTSDWKYKNEYKIYKIVKESGLKDFNIANLAYDTMALAPKYLLIRDNILFNKDDYYHNKYLFVVSRGQNYEKDPAYEVATFKPRKIIKEWEINKTYTMYLLERLDE